LPQTLPPPAESVDANAEEVVAEAIESPEPTGEQSPSEVPLPTTATLVPVDLTKLPIGTDFVSTTGPNVGWIWACRVDPNIASATVMGPWILDDRTWDLTSKAIVGGENTWPNSVSITVEDIRRVIVSNALPNHPTGTYPVSSNDDAYQYDRNPNTISAQNVNFDLPANPEVAAQPSCVEPTAGIFLNGVFLFNALDGPGRDAVAIETQDLCQGHPEMTGVYHYHSLSTCLPDAEPGTVHSPLMGYAFDGFGIYGSYREIGETMTNAGLDECHGHVHEIEWDGSASEMFHYHATWEFPYAVGCTRGTLDTDALNAVRSLGGQTGQGQQGSDTGGGATGGEPDMSAAAAILGITEADLQAALVPPPPDLKPQCLCHFLS